MLDNHIAQLSILLFYIFNLQIFRIREDKSFKIIIPNNLFTNLFKHNVHQLGIFPFRGRTI
jgi:hypothetical protein